MNTRINTLLLSLPLILLLCGANQVVLAEEPSSHSNEQRAVQSGLPVFSAHDTNRDGVLSRDEYQQFTNGIREWRQASGRPMHGFTPLLNFAAVDANHDGFISEDEMTSVLNQRLQQRRRYRFRGNW
ncbi:MAG: hypothetical protein PVG66_12435 [Chromatiales bacterium]|jgi:hypothetical protein